MVRTFATDAAQRCHMLDSQCCQDWDAAQEALFDMASQAGPQSGLVAGAVKWLV